MAAIPAARMPQRDSPDLWAVKGLNSPTSARHSQSSSSTEVEMRAAEMDVANARVEAAMAKAQAADARLSFLKAQKARSESSGLSRQLSEVMGNDSPVTGTRVGQSPERPEQLETDGISVEGGSGNTQFFRMDQDDSDGEAVGSTLESTSASTVSALQALAHQTIINDRNQCRDEAARFVASERQAFQHETVMRAEAAVDAERARLAHVAGIAVNEAVAAQNERNNQLASAMVDQRDRELVQRFMEERMRLEREAQNTAAQYTEAAERRANAKIAEAELQARHEVEAIQYRAQQQMAEALAQQEHSAKAVEDLERTTAQKIEELHCSLRMQASAESAEAWASYKIDTQAAGDRENAAIAKQLELENNLARRQQEAAELQERNRSLAASVHRLTAALGAVPESPLEPSFHNPAAKQSSGTATQSVSNSVAETVPNAAASGASSSGGGPPPPSDPPGGGAGSSRRDSGHDDDPGDRRNNKKPPAAPSGGDPPGGDDGGGGGGPLSSSSDDDEDVPERRRRARPTTSSTGDTPDKARAKEADSIKIGQMPTPVQFQAWQDSLRHEVCAASGKRKIAFPWIFEAEDPNTTFEDLAEPGKDFETLDSKLSSALRKILTGPIGREITRLSTEEAKRNRRQMSGRQTLWMIYQEFQMEEKYRRSFRNLGAV